MKLGTAIEFMKAAASHLNPALHDLEIESVVIDSREVQAGDVLTQVNDVEIREPRQLLLTVSQIAPGTAVTLHYERDGKERTATATLGS